MTPRKEAMRWRRIARLAHEKNQRLDCALRHVRGGLHNAVVAQREADSVMNTALHRAVQAEHWGKP